MNSGVRTVAKRLLPTIYSLYPPSQCFQKYRRTFGRFPNVILPRRLTEKVQRKMLFDRNPMATVFADKVRVRNYVRSRLGGEECLSKYYAVVESADQISHLELPNSFVMKPSHTSGDVRIVRDASNLELGELESLAGKWLKRNFYKFSGEWGYKNVKPRIIFEELLGANGQIPMDYKFHCFHGEPRFILVVKDRFGPQRMQNYYGIDLTRLQIKDRRFRNFDDDIKPVPNYGKMLDVARRLSRGVDFVRIDLYSFGDRVVFGEMTNYPAGGLVPYDPPSWDYKFGSYW
ncbi:MAG TPA: ATP-grasp fold amidoligase family protein [Nitrososphaerales archaeon]|nr:ATP-grasp fold amidoligase family protein [Nitrososphaerales archaeon]